MPAQPHSHPWIADEGWHSQSLMASLTAPERAAFLSLGTARGFDRGSLLMRFGETGREAHLILGGCVKVLGADSQGHTTLLAIRMAGDIVGELSVLDGRPRSATVMAAAPTRVRTIGGTVLRDFLGARPAIGNAVQNSVNAKLREAIGHRTAATGAPVVTRLVRVLEKLGRYCGRRTDEGLVITAPLSQADLAALVGTTEQSIRRALGTLRGSGVLITRYRQVVITDTARLAAMSQDCPGDTGGRE
ncbi:Crp/Fnr family transcriptional regulator [Nocardiopsis valliformis]|uniref:Crp/Fnr family transcriptional regulator n=1 Tax=Nocardiopsis valliformis TaxID=239974 RepID=UPI00034C48FE|nr:Crp/Fnr family transcriptional regulator [Nocardiopsis valliformis]